MSQETQSLLQPSSPSRVGRKRQLRGEHDDREEHDYGATSSLHPASKGQNGSLLLFERLRRPLPRPSKRREGFMLAALMLTMVLCGWNEGSLGPLIPFLQEYYHVNYTVMSLIFVTGFVGSLVAGFMNVFITDRIGLGLTAPLGALSHVISYAIAGTGGPYPLFLVAFVFNGFGLGLQDAQVNNLTSRLSSPTTKLSIVQACYGLGATIAPFLSTAFASTLGTRAYRYFWLAMGVAMVTVVVMGVVFEGRTMDQVLGVGYMEDDIPGEGASVSREEDVPEIEEEKEDGGSWSKMKRIGKTPATWTILLFSFIYVGVEVCISGWLTSFLIRERGGTASAGYATTGFWAGMTVGRIVLIPLTDKLGYRLSVYLYSAASVLLLVFITLSRSLLLCAGAYTLIGVLLGPIYPSALLLMASILDDDLRGGMIGLMGCVGAAGGAVFPFVAGAISDRFGIWTLNPFSIALVGLDMVLWGMIPHKI